MKKRNAMALGLLAGMVTGGVVAGKMGNKTVEQKNAKVEKFKGYYNMLNQWLILKQEGKSLVEYFTNNNYKKIAIYGMGEMGNRLYDELKNSDIEIAYAVDKDVDGIYSELQVIDKEDLDQQVEVDVMVVTATFAFEEISEEISNSVDCPIISLEDVVYEI